MRYAAIALAVCALVGGPSLAQCLIRNSVSDSPCRPAPSSPPLAKPPTGYHKWVVGPGERGGTDSEIRSFANFESDSQASGNVPADWQGVWCWGTLWHNSTTPFLKIEQRDGHWVLQTKNYMHSDFEATVKDVHLDGQTLGFTYWYTPLKRWATCNFTLAGFVMAGRCDAETSAQTWGVTDSYLWREGVLKRPPAIAPGPITPESTTP